MMLRIHFIPVAREGTIQGIVNGVKEDMSTAIVNQRTLIWQVPRDYCEMKTILRR